MKKLTILLIGCCVSVFSFANEGVSFVKNLSWSQILAKAAREKKMIFFDAYTTWCGPCKYLEENVYTDANVAAYFNANYINVKFDMEDGEGIKLSEQFDINSYPTLIFFSPAGKPVHKVVGAMEADEFLQLGMDAKDPAKQYYTLKDKISAAKGTTAEFVLWTEMASDLDDTNRGTVSSNWLAAQKDILGSVELARVTMSNTEVNESQLAYLYSQKNRIQQLLEWDAAKTEHGLYRKLFNLAVSGYESHRSLEKFIALVKKFAPERIAAARAELNMLEAFSIYDRDKAMEILIKGIRAADKVNLDDICFLFLDYSNKFTKYNVEQLSESLNSYTFNQSDKGKECWLYLTQVICYAKLEDAAKAKENAIKANSYAELPESYRAVLKESYGL